MKKWGLALLITISLVGLPSSGLEVDVSTTIPGYIMDDYLNLSGTVNMTRGQWTDDAASDFNQGVLRNVSIKDDSVLLKPSIDFQIMNNGNAILSPGTGTDWDKVFIPQGVDVIKHDDTYYLFYVGSVTSSLMSPRHIGLATSSDGVNFTKYPGNPILRSRVDSYDYSNLMSPVVLVENGTFHMWYAGNRGNRYPTDSQDVNICYANSTDGFNWSKHTTNPVITNNASNNAWNGIDIRPCDIFTKDNSYILTYWGTGSNDIVHKYGISTSTDRLNWMANPNNPLYNGDVNGWENGLVTYKGVQKSNDTYRTWTNSVRTTSPSIGWIYSSDLDNWFDSGAAVIVPKANTIYSTAIGTANALDHGKSFVLYFRGTDDSAVSRMGAFNCTPIKLDGSFTSRIFNAGAEVRIEGVDWNASVINGSRINFSIQWSNDSIDWSDWTPIDNGSTPRGITARYIRYKAEFQVERDWMRPALNQFRIYYEIPVTVVEISVDGGQWQPANLVQTQWHLNVSLHDGDYFIDVKVTDSLGDSVTESILVKVDLNDPVLDLILEEGRYATNSSTISYTLAGEDTHGPLEQMISFRSDFLGAQWETHTPIGKLEYEGPDGIVEVYAKLKDAAGRTSITQLDTILLDTSPPEGTLLINEGADYTNSTMVTLRWNATDITGVVGMMASNDPDFEGAIWQDPMDAFSWAIGEADGTHTVYLRIRDFDGWTAVLVDDIILDRTPPSATLKINQDAAFTTMMDVMLNITLYDENPIRYKLTNYGQSWPDAWRTSDTPVDIPWILFTQGPDGKRTVQMLVMDAAGHEVLVTDDIVLDTIPPEGTLVLNGGATFTDRLAVDVSLLASDATSGMDKMRVSNSDDFTGASWRTLEEAFIWPMPEGEGPKTLFVQIRDLVGLVSTLDATIIMDTTAPNGILTINEGEDHVRTAQVALHLAFDDDFGLDVCRVSNSLDFTDVQWMTYVAIIMWDLVDEGERTVYLEVRDEAGNVATSEATIIYDETPPAIEFLSPKKKVTTEEKVTVQVSVTDNVDQTPVVEWRLDEGAWETLVGTSFQIKLTDGDHSIEVRSTDGAGNEALEALELEKEPEPSIASGPFLWIIVVVVVVVIGVGYWQWKGKASS